MELRKRLRIQEKERQPQVVEWFNTKKAVGEENAQKRIRKSQFERSHC